MGLFDKVWNWFAPALKQKNIWQSYYGASSSYTTNTYDRFNGQPEPTKLDLIRAYDDVVFSCVSLIAYNIGITPIRLYVKTATGQRRPKCLVNPVSEKMRPYMRSKFFGQQVDEVAEHAALDLISRCNPYHNKVDLLQGTATFLDLTGNAYWLLAYNDLGIPHELYPLPPQYVTPERDANGFIRKWKYGSGLEQKEYDLDQVVHFKHFNPSDPYGEGLSPTRGAWSRIQIGMKELAFLDNSLTNMGRPDTLVAIKDSIAPFEAERLAKEWTHRFQGSGNGGPLVVDGTVNVSPLSYQPKDLAELQLYQVVKTSVANAYHIPPDLFEMGQSNRATADAALYYLAMHCLKPRLHMITEKLNERIIPYFDNRLFFAADDVVPEDKQFEMSARQMLLNSGVMLRDEARELYGLTSEEWAKEPLLPSGAMPVGSMIASSETASEMDAAPQANEGDNVLDSTQQTEGSDAASALRATVGGSSQIMALQTAVVAGTLTTEMARANARIIFGLSTEEANALFPEQPAPAPAPAAPVAPPVPAKAIKKKQLIDLPDFRQAGNYDCGAAATHSVCGYFKVGAETEDEMIAALGTTPQAGTSPAQIIDYLEAQGLTVEARDGMDVEQLAEANAGGSPVICAIQDYGTPAQENANKSGHYVVVIDVNLAEQILTLQDPSAGQVQMTAAEFVDHWHDMDDEGDLIRFGILVSKQDGKCGGEGGTRGPCPEGGSEKPSSGGSSSSSGGSGSSGGGHVAAAHTEAAKKSSSLVERAKQIPGKLYEKAKTSVANKYKALEARYGKKMAVTIMAFGIVGTAAPLPGSGLIAAAPVIAVAELYRAFHKSVKSDDDPEQFSEEELKKLGEQFMGDLLGEWQDDPDTQEAVAEADAQEQESKSFDSVRVKSLKQKEPEELVKKLQEFFRLQATEVSKKAKSIHNIHQKATDASFINVEDWTNRMAKYVQPTMKVYYDHAAKELVQQLGVTPSLFKTVQPKLREGMDKSILLFCKETQETTSQELTHAIEELRERITAGLEEGDVKTAMMDRVKSVFDLAENSRAWRIGVTESSRAQHAAATITATESGVVKGKRWLLSSEACPECQPLANKTVALDANFTVDGTGAYAEIPYPPLHPHCRCDMTFVVD